MPVLLEKCDILTRDMCSIINTEREPKRKRQENGDSSNGVAVTQCIDGGILHLKRQKLVRQNENLILEQEKLKLEREKLKEEIKKIALEKEVLALTKNKLQMDIQSSLYPLLAASMQGPHFFNKLFGDISNGMEGAHNKK